MWEIIHASGEGGTRFWEARTKADPSMCPGALAGAQVRSAEGEPRESSLATLAARHHRPLGLFFYTEWRRWHCPADGANRVLPHVGVLSRVIDGPSVRSVTISSPLSKY